jgi:hypothetical protein
MHDPGDPLRENFNQIIVGVQETYGIPGAELIATIDELVIYRFGLNVDFIDAHNLSWIDGLETSSGKDLADPRHRDHFKPYVQNYIRQFGARKCEANALVVAPAAGRQLLLDTIHQYISPDARARYAEALKAPREALRVELLRQLREGSPAIEEYEQTQQRIRNMTKDPSDA